MNYTVTQRILINLTQLLCLRYSLQERQRAIQAA